MDNAIIFSSTIEEIQKNIQRLKTQSMRRAGLGISDMSCLMMLKKHPEGLSSTELSRHCHLDKALISRTVQKLIKKEVIAYDYPRLPAIREPDPEGVVRRGAYRVPLHLTEEGAKLTDELYGVAAAAATYIAEHIDEQDMAVFYRTLDKVSQNLKDFLASRNIEDTCEDEQ
jgi:DNA-binding MarR family transcriptional regulator